MMEELEKELKLATLNELEDHLSELSDILYSKSYEYFDADDFDKIFRIVHSIKGNTRASGYAEIADVSHIYESQLIKVRTAEEEYTEGFHDLSLSFLHQLTDSLEILNADMEALIDLSALKDILETGPIEHEQTHDAVAEVQSVKAASPQANLKVLIIDDDHDVQEIIQSYIEHSFEGNFTLEENGRHGLDVCQSEKFDVIICDYKMPILDGKEFIASLRNGLNPNKKTPIIFLSGYRPQLQADGSVWENVFFIEKPCTESKLVYYVKCAVELNKEKMAA